MTEPVREDGRSPSAYVLGHSDHELVRLTKQARLKDPITRRFFVDSGLSPGMRVLDVGSGAGDVAFLAGELVGDAGAVVGFDRSPAAVATARRRAEERSIANVTFVEGDVHALAPNEPFDAVVGRYVLQFQSDPAATLRSLATRLRPDGIVVFHELDWAGVCSVPPAPVYDTASAWCRETLSRSGTERHMGSKLDRAFVDAGLPAPTLRLEAVIGGERDREDSLSLVADLVVTLAPEIVRLGVAKEDELDLETLHERMIADAADAGSVIIGHWQVGAWTRV